MSCRTRSGIHTCVRKVAPCPTWMPDRVRHDEEWSMKAAMGRDSKTRYNGAMLDDLPHVLVVDDDRRLRDLLRRYLADNGFRVTAAVDAADARSHLKAFAFEDRKSTRLNSSP